MLDPNFVRENPDIIKGIIDSGRGDSKKADVEKWLKLDKQRSQLLTRLNETNQRRNELSKAGKDGDIEKIREEGKYLKEEVKKIQTQLDIVLKQWQEIMDWFPNVPVEPMPEGNSEEDNIVQKLWIPKKGYSKDAVGKKARNETEYLMPEKPIHSKNKDFTPKHHLDIGQHLKVIDIEQSAKTSGSRFSYLLGELVLMQYALQQLLFEELIKRGYKPIAPPLLVKDHVLYGTSHFPEGRDQVYAIKADNVEDKNQLFLLGSSEPANFAYFMDKTLDQKDLPIKIFAYEPAFRSEAGSWGKDVKGIKRVHQFHKIEMNAITTKEQSQDIYKEFLEINEWLLQKLELPYQLVKKCTGDAGYLAAAAQVDPEVWLPGQNEFIEVMTATNATDYQARRLNIKYKTKDNKLEFAHTVNDTGCAMGRMLISILCNYQQKDGSVLVPKALRKYVSFKEIKQGK